MSNNVNDKYQSWLFKVQSLNIISTLIEYTCNKMIFLLIILINKFLLAAFSYYYNIISNIIICY